MLRTTDMDRAAAFYGALAGELGGSTEFVHTVPKHGRVGSLREPRRSLRDPRASTLIGRGEWTRLALDTERW